MPGSALTSTAPIGSSLKRDDDDPGTGSLSKETAAYDSFGSFGSLPHVSVAENVSVAEGFFVSSQAHLLKPTQDNPLPTAVPPPIAATAGTLGVRHVLCLIGLPERGKPFIAGRLDAYLSFFHGAEVRRFNINEYSRQPGGSDENAEALLKDLRDFMSSTSTVAGRNMDHHIPAHENDLVASQDRRRKNVDSGKVAIIFCSDSVATFKDKWSGTSKERRRWIAEVLRQDRKLGAKLIFIEVIVNKPDIIEANIKAKRRALDQGEATPEDMHNHYKRVQQYQRMYVTLQDDGSEDDLSYIKLYNYGGKVVTNRMHGYLRMRIAQFLTTIHTTPHVIYLSRHGQSEYNVLGKIGGNPPLSEQGSEYAERLGAWVPKNIWQMDGKLIKCRLWTSSLQRTILTAAHIPHPMLRLGDSTSAYCASHNACSPTFAASSASTEGVPASSLSGGAATASNLVRSCTAAALSPASSPFALLSRQLLHDHSPHTHCPHTQSSHCPSTLSHALAPHCPTRPGRMRSTRRASSKANRSNQA